MLDPAEQPISIRLPRSRYDPLIVAVVPSAFVIATGLWLDTISKGVLVPWCAMGLLGANLLTSRYFWQIQPLKDVYLAKGGLRVVDQRGRAAFIPYGAIRSVREPPSSDFRVVVVRLWWKTALGRRFTFIPRDHSAWSEDVVAALRRSIAAATAVKDGKPAGRSVMADAELDGPF